MRSHLALAFAAAILVRAEDRIAYDTTTVGTDHEGNLKTFTCCAPTLTIFQPMGPASGAPAAASAPPACPPAGEPGAVVTTTVTEYVTVPAGGAPASQPPSASAWVDPSSGAPAPSSDPNAPYSGDPAAYAGQPAAYSDPPLYASEPAPYPAPTPSASAIPSPPLNGQAQDPQYVDGTLVPAGGAATGGAAVGGAATVDPLASTTTTPPPGVAQPSTTTSTDDRQFIDGTVAGAGGATVIPSLTNSTAPGEPTLDPLAASASLNPSETVTNPDGSVETLPPGTNSTGELDEFGQAASIIRDDPQSEAGPGVATPSAEQGAMSMVSARAALLKALAIACATSLLYVCL